MLSKFNANQIYSKVKNIPNLEWKNWRSVLLAICGTPKKLKEQLTKNMFFKILQTNYNCKLKIKKSFQWILNLFITRQLISNDVSILRLLFTYYFEAAHATGTLICWSFIFIFAVGPMPFYLAQLVFALAWATADVMFILSSFMSIAKILYVTHFDWIFNLNQELVSQAVLTFSFLVGIIPHLVICIHQSAKGLKVTAAVAYFMGENIVPQPPTPTNIYGAFWLFLSVAMLFVATLFIQFNFIMFISLL